MWCFLEQAQHHRPRPHRGTRAGLPPSRGGRQDADTEAQATDEGRTLAHSPRARDGDEKLLQTILPAW